MTTARELLQAVSENECMWGAPQLKAAIDAFLAQPEPAAPDYITQETIDRCAAEMSKIIADNMSKLYDDAKPEPSAGVELVAALNAAAIDYAQCWKGGEPDEAAFRDLGFGRGKLFGLAAEALERLVRERDYWQERAGLADSTLESRGRNITDILAESRLRLERAEAAERDAERYRYLAADPICWDEGDGISAFILNAGERTWKGKSLDAAIDAAIAQEKP